MKVGFFFATSFRDKWSCMVFGGMSDYIYLQAVSESLAWVFLSILRLRVSVDAETAQYLNWFLSLSTNRTAFVQKM